ncbi:hypothetical protein Moror_17018 [Moniliophthora roreri MCA 2997]|uniref:Uncharacterized protein n=1 Tax=Moniliophthora roreri (strain MCA 2997) TaxID=1381753 RepID=V2XXP1_MONRO|nr:hypothetical protein Moror_17018 [Moniliophthora roreri MCA 2997]
MFGQYGWIRERHERESKGNRKERARLRRWIMGAHEPVILAKNKDLVLNSMKEEEEEETDTKAEKVVTEKAGDSAHFWRSLVGTLPDVESRTPTSPTLEQSACLEEKHDSEKASNLHPKILQAEEPETARQPQCHDSRPEHSKPRPTASGLRDGSPIDRNE